jgi:hypothetical protein
MALRSRKGSRGVSFEWYAFGAVQKRSDCFQLEILHRTETQSRRKFRTGAKRLLSTEDFAPHGDSRFAPVLN